MKCRHCDQPQEAHHEFEPYRVPDGCKCDPNDWFNPDAITAICKDYVEGPSEGQCNHCEHLRECHKESAA